MSNSDNSYYFRTMDPDTTPSSTNETQTEEETVELETQAVSSEDAMKQRPSVENLEKEDVIIIKEAVTEIKEDVTEIKEEVTAVKKDVTEIKKADANSQGENDELRYKANRYCIPHWMDAQKGR